MQHKTMKLLNKTVLFILILSSISIKDIDAASNLTCYQCVRYANVECGPEDLLPCPEISDRCVTHISKNAEIGFSIKRECGLGPCSFDDPMVNKGLGLGGDCNRNRDEFFCIFCCRQSGCNKNIAVKTITLPTMITIILLIICIICK